MLDWLCKARLWYITFILYSATYHVVVLSVDRVTAVLLPFKYRTLNFSTVAASISFLTVMTSLALSFTPFLFSAYNPAIKSCGPEQGQNFIFYYGIVFYVGLPFVVLSGCNIVFVSALFKRRRRNAARNAVNAATDSRPTVRQQHENSYIRMLVITATSFLMLLVTGILLSLAAFAMSESEATVSLGKWFAVLSDLPLVLNHSLNFCFYLASGRMFRLAFAKAFPRLYKRDQPSQPENGTAATGDVEMHE